MNAPSILLSRRVASSSICLSCRRSLLRQFSASARKPAAAPFQSYPLNPRATTPINPPPSLRDTAQRKGVDGTIAQPPPLPTVHETRPPRERDGTPTEKRAGKAEASASEVKETEAPKAASSRTPPTQTQSTAPASSTPPSTTAAPAATPAKPRSRLRTPRKAAMKLTPAAVAHLRALLDQPDPKLIKVGVRNRGCSGLAYHLEFVERAGAFDETVEQDGVRVLIDSKALFSIIGSEMDWVEDKLSQRFVFRNPNIKEQCGCGESFMV